MCSLLEGLERWNGVEIEVRGKIRTSGGFWLSGVTCASKVRIGPVTFPDAIALTDPSTDKRLKIHPVSFKWDTTSRDDLRRAVREAELLGEEVEATIVGVFETRVPLNTLAGTAEDDYRGFGNQSMAPGQILIRTVQNIRRLSKRP